jgi:hypothetical protein
MGMIGHDNSITQCRRIPRSRSTGVANSAGADGVTFLDRVWDQAPFANHDQFVATVERVAGEFGQQGLFTAEQRTAIVDGARRAEPDLRV